MDGTMKMRLEGASDPGLRRPDFEVVSGSAAVAKFGSDRLDNLMAWRAGYLIELDQALVYKEVKRIVLPHLPHLAETLSQILDPAGPVEGVPLPADLPALPGAVAGGGLFLSAVPQVVFMSDQGPLSYKLNYTLVQEYIHNKDAPDVVPGSGVFNDEYFYPDGWPTSEEEAAIACKVDSSMKKLIEKQLGIKTLFESRVQLLTLAPVPTTDVDDFKRRISNMQPAQVFDELKKEVHRCWNGMEGAIDGALSNVQNMAKDLQEMTDKLEKDIHQLVYNEVGMLGPKIESLIKEYYVKPLLIRWEQTYKKIKDNLDKAKAAGQKIVDALLDATEVVVEAALADLRRIADAAESLERDVHTGIILGATILGGFIGFALAEWVL